MGLNLTQKIIREHLIEGEPRPGEEVAIRIDRTLTHDTLGLMALLEFEAMGIPRVKTELSVSYVDHNILQLGYESNDDHRFLQGVCAKYGLLYSRAGNGICHQVNLERFSAPGKTLLGADSHTTTSGAVGMLAIGAGGLDVAAALGGEPYYFRMPRIVQVVLKGRLGPWVSSKDIVLELLRRLGVKGGLDCIFEYTGDGVATLSVPERGTICNMGTELGATTSIFPGDAKVHAYLKAQKRESDFRPMAADDDASYDDGVEIELEALEPLIACPGSPDNVVPVREVAGTRVEQVCIGSCTNSSYVDLMTVAAILMGRVAHPRVSLAVSPGSRQVFNMIARSGALSDLISSGARILESACGPCLGVGQAPGTDMVSVRTFNRNFPGRSGTRGDRVYLASPQIAAAAALHGEIVDPRGLGDPPRFDFPREFLVDDRMILLPSAHPETVELLRGPNIKPLPIATAPGETLRAMVVLKTGDNISTDDIAPAGAKAVPLRANVPALAEFTFEGVDSSFVRRAKQAGSSIIVGGSNYGQGSSREHAALCPMFLGVKMVLAKSFARIHRDNLVNFGVLPVTFVNEADYDGIDQDDVLEVAGVRQGVASGHDLVVRDVTKGVEIPVRHSMSPRMVQIYLDGGRLNHVKKQAMGG
jgi:aconitate hydratase